MLPIAAAAAPPTIAIPIRPSTNNSKHTQTKNNYSQKQHKNLNNHAGKLSTYTQTEGNETKDWFRGLSVSGLFYSSRGIRLHRSVWTHQTYMMYDCQY